MWRPRSSHRLRQQEVDARSNVVLKSFQELSKPNFTHLMGNVFTVNRPDTQGSVLAKAG